MPEVLEDFNMDFTWYVTGVVLRVTSLVQVLALIYVIHSMLKVKKEMKRTEHTVAEIKRMVSFLHCQPMVDELTKCPCNIDLRGQEENDD